MALSNVPGRTPLGAFYRSPLGVFTRGGEEVTYHVALISRGWTDGLGGRSSYNAYKPTVPGNARWQTDKTAWEADNAAFGIPQYYAVLQFLNAAPGIGGSRIDSFYQNCNPVSIWKYQFITHCFVDLYCCRVPPGTDLFLSTMANTYLWNALVRLCITDDGSCEDAWAHYLTEGSSTGRLCYHPDGVVVDPSKTQLKADRLKATHIEFHIEDSVEMSYANLNAQLTYAKNELDSEGISYNDNIYTTVNYDDANQGRWVDWFAATR